MLHQRTPTKWLLLTDSPILGAMTFWSSELKQNPEGKGGLIQLKSDFNFTLFAESREQTSLKAQEGRSSAPSSNKECPTNIELDVWLHQSQQQQHIDKI